MNKNLIEELEKALEKEKSDIEEQLKKFATKDEKLPGDWDTRFPNFNAGQGSSGMETAADEVEEYSTLLPIEHNLEIRLENINLALGKIKTSLSARTLKDSPILEKGKYGICERCGKGIQIERLKISPEAKFCLKCE